MNTVKNQAIEFKKCSCCGEIKPKSEFKHGTCKICVNERNKKRYREKQYYKKYKDKLNRYFVYRLIKNDEIVYVGRTTSFIKRMENHKKTKDFDRVEILIFDNPIDMKIAELYFINRYKPILNSADKHNEDSLSLYELDVFTRTRGEHHQVYVELKTKKQKLIQSFKNKDKAEDLKNKIKQMKAQEQISNVSA